MRCYNGAPDSALQAILDRDAALTQQLRRRSPNAHCTHFPMEGRYQVWLGTRPVAEAWYTTREAALRAALEVL